MKLQNLLGITSSSLTLLAAGTHDLAATGYFHGSHECMEASVYQTILEHVDSQIDPDTTDLLAETQYFKMLLLSLMNDPNADGKSEVLSYKPKLKKKQFRIGGKMETFQVDEGVHEVKRVDGLIPFLQLPPSFEALAYDRDGNLSPYLFNSKGEKKIDLDPTEDYNLVLQRQTSQVQTFKISKDLQSSIFHNLVELSQQPLTRLENRQVDDLVSWASKTKFIDMHPENSFSVASDADGRSALAPKTVKVTM